MVVARERTIICTTLHIRQTSGLMHFGDKLNAGCVQKQSGHASAGESEKKRGGRGEEASTKHANKLKSVYPRGSVQM